MKKLVVLLLVALMGCTAIPKLCALLPDVPSLGQLNGFCPVTPTPVAQ